MTDTRLEIGDNFPKFDESPFLIAAAWDMAVAKFPHTTKLTVTRHGAPIVICSNGKVEESSR